jgi:hypothetical protein
MSRAKPFTLLLLLVLFASWTRPAVAQDQVPKGVDGTTYTGPTFGYSISWDGDYWVLFESGDTTSEGDGLKLDVKEPGAGVLSIAWFSWSPTKDAEDYVAVSADILDSPDITDRHQAEANGQPIGGHDETSAYVVDEFTYKGDPLVEYIECRQLEPDTVGFCVTFVTPRDEFNSHLPHIQELLDTMNAAGDIQCDLIDPHATVTPTTNTAGCEEDLIDPHAA